MANLEKGYLVTYYKDEDKYFFSYTAKNFGRVLETLNRFAKNDELNFTWYDAVSVIQLIKKGIRENR